MHVGIAAYFGHYDRLLSSVQGTRTGKVGGPPADNERGAYCGAGTSEQRIRRVIPGLPLGHEFWKTPEFSARGMVNKKKQAVHN
jgi:hypothetical protein